MKYFTIFVFILSMINVQGQQLEFTSPDGKIQISYFLSDCYPQRKDAGSDPGCLFYQISYKNKPVIEKSALGLILAGAPTLKSNFEIVDTIEKHVNNSWQPVYGERSPIPDHYREVIVFLRETIYPHRYINIEFRAYNEGVAFRYYLPTQASLQSFTLDDEFTYFQLPENTIAWANFDRMQTQYQRMPVSELRDNASRPLLFQLSDNLFAAVLEADVENYSRVMIDKAEKFGDNLLHCKLFSPVQAKAPFATSWKLILIGDTPGELLGNNYLVQNLNHPNQLRSTEWIKPGKIMREMTLSTAGGKKYIDFAAAHNIQYLLYDGGWYGDPIVDVSDASQADPWQNKIKNIKNHQGLDLQEVVAYGKRKGVGIFLYLDRRVVERRMDYLLPIFKKWGVKGLKFGFVNVGSQSWNQWLQDMVKKCADYQLMVNVHDEYYPTGLSRTYPNLLTQEGILGNEAMPSADHNVNLAFTRMLAGAADYTPAYYMRKELGHPKKFIKTTPAHQLALPVVFYSPLQSLFWYDHPEDYQGEPEIEFWEQVPTTWDDTKVLDAKIGQYIVIARKKNEDWFIGGITNSGSRSVNLQFEFLENNRTYEGRLFFDDPDSETRTKVGIKNIKVNSKENMGVKIKSSGGFAMKLTAIP